jgi:hypothetical protein
LLEATVAPFRGEEIRTDGRFAEDGIRPIGAGLQEPARICLPSVMGKPGIGSQKLIKLFVEVRLAVPAEVP